jgi:hypothetical protein
MRWIVLYGAERLGSGFEMRVRRFMAKHFVRQTQPSPREFFDGRRYPHATFHGTQAKAILEDRTRQNGRTEEGFLSSYVVVASSAICINPQPSFVIALPGKKQEPIIG